MAQDGRPLGGGGVGAACGGDSIPEDPHPITLAAPRPDHTRTSNVYVETPFKHRVAPRRPPGPHHHGSSSSSSSSHHHHHHHHLHSQDLPLVHGGVSGVRSSGKRGVKSGLTTTSSTAATTLKTSTLGKTSSSTAPLASIKGRSPATTTSSSLGGKTLSAGIVTKQPAASPTAATLTFTKGVRDAEGDTDSIICAVCGKCRCEACRTPRPLPSRWLCQNKCLCSPSACVDYTSCLCCVKGVLYHCGADGAGDGSGVAVADQPCACTGPHACIRWTCLASASVVLPCLLCYWPLRAATRVVELCYQKYTNHGCQCQAQQQQQHHTRGDVSPEKRLLQDCV